VDQKPIWEEDPDLITSDRTNNFVDESVAQYTGGYILVRKSLYDRNLITIHCFLSTFSPNRKNVTFQYMRDLVGYRNYLTL
jgi:hypothetical protein